MEENHYKNYMWRTYPREDRYRFQTNDPTVADKLRRVVGKKKSKPMLVSNGVNTYHKIYEIAISSPKIELNVFKRVVNQKLEKTDERGLFYAKTPHILHKK